MYRNEVLHSADERTQVLQDIASDPTLPRTKTVRCANCQHGEAVFFQVTLFVSWFWQLLHEEIKPLLFPDSRMWRSAIDLYVKLKVRI